MKRSVSSSIKIIIIIFILAAFIFYLGGCGIYFQHHIKKDFQEDLNETGLQEVIDGDTIVIPLDLHVRLIGINAPEKDSYYYEESKSILEIILKDKDLYLEKDVEDKDQYGRLLRYLYTDDIFVNLEMVKRGFANVYTNPPNVKYIEDLLEAERHAREHDLGLWKRSGVENIKIEINYDAQGNDNKNLNGEYIVLFNDSDMDFEIGRWNIKDSARNSYIFANYLFESKKRILLFTGNGKDEEGKFFWNSTSPIWNNDHDTLYLRDADGMLIGIYDY